MFFSGPLVTLFSIVLSTSPAAAKLPATYKYGTNIGGWLLSESWMNPNEWAAMGGEDCSDLSACATSEWSLTRKLGQVRANEVFLEHWQSWFTLEHILQLKSLMLDHVRIPLGFWIIEELVEHPDEHYPQGGWMELKRGLRQLRDTGFHVSLDMHALPGIAASNQLFAGNYTTDVQFYKDSNYQRALTWSAVLTAMSHYDPDFASVVGIECINEPVSDPLLTPGLGQYYADFVTITRVVEYAFGVECETDLEPAIDRLSNSRNAPPALQAAIPLMIKYAAKANLEMDSTIIDRLESYLDCQSSESDAQSYMHPCSVSRANNPARKTRQARSHMSRYHHFAKRRRAFPESGIGTSYKSCIVTMAMSKAWQTKGDGPSMAKYTLGPAAYDDHMYYAFGGLADPNITSYLSTMCNSKQYENAKARGEVPHGHGEFSLATNFNGTLDQLRDWGDAQRFVYSKENYWTFWTFRVENVMELKLNRSLADSWSYFGAVEAGIWPRDPSKYYNPFICEPYTLDDDDSRK